MLLRIRVKDRLDLAQTRQLGVVGRAVAVRVQLLDRLLQLRQLLLARLLELFFLALELLVERDERFELFERRLLLVAETGLDRVQFRRLADQTRGERLELLCEKGARERMYIGSATIS